MLSKGGIFAACFAGVAVLLLAPAAARAQVSETVYLRNGGMLRGTVTEVVPGDHATVALATGQVATVQWAQIERIERAPRPEPQVSALPVPASVKTVVVHIESERPVRLEVKGATGKSWIPMCKSPCDVPVPLVATYRILGDGVRGTAPFGLDGAPGQTVVVEVDPASKAGFAGGIVLVSVAPIVSVIGLVLLVAGQPHGSTAGLGLTLGGLVGVGAGIFLVINNSSSAETQTVRQPVKPIAEREREGGTWRPIELAAALPPPPPQLMIPVFAF